MSTILLADDHPITAMGTKAFVESLGYSLVAVCGSGIAAYNNILSREPDIALLDMNMPGMNAIDILEKLARQRCRTQVVVLTMHNEESIFNRARALGARGYVLKEFAPKELETCLSEVSNNRSWFSPQLSQTLVADAQVSGTAGLEALTFSERKILQLVAQEHTSKTIAQLLFISEKTVENHRSSILKKLNISSERNALLVWAVKNVKNEF
jgi:DNA-binding NarL/FixJ family response regulator